MRGILIAIVITLGLSAPALAEHNHPAKSKVLKINFVTAYESCALPTLEHRPPFDGPLLACTPVLSTGTVDTHQITFAADGRLAASIKVTKGDVKISFKGVGILDHGTPFSGPLQGVVNLRATDAGCVGPDFFTACTLSELPFLFTVGCTAGVCKGKSTANLVIPGALQDGDEGNIEFGQVTVIDEDGDECFRMGLFVP